MNFRVHIFFALLAGQVGLVSSLKDGAWSTCKVDEVSESGPPQNRGDGGWSIKVSARGNAYKVK